MQLNVIYSRTSHQIASTCFICGSVSKCAIYRNSACLVLTGYLCKYYVTTAIFIIDLAVDVASDILDGVNRQYITVACIALIISSFGSTTTTIISIIKVGFDIIYIIFIWIGNNFIFFCQ